jgi:hypothetical protein
MFDTVGSIVTRLRSGQSKVRISAGAKDFFRLQNTQSFPNACMFIVCVGKTLPFLPYRIEILCNYLAYTNYVACFLILHLFYK